MEVIHSSLHRFFDELVAEEKDRANHYPIHRGELNFCLRGCYSSVAKFKFPYRRTEAALVRAEKTDSVVSAHLGRSAQDLKAAWKSVLFNSFHDILPGSSIERAYEDQLAWLGVAYHDAQKVEFNALNALASDMDTSVPKPDPDYPSRVPVLVWNPHLHEYKGPVEIEAAMDYRPIWEYQDRFDEVPVELVGPKGTPVPFQVIRTENSSMQDLPWRRRVVFQAKLLPMSWSIYQIGLARKMKPAKVASPAQAVKPGFIANRYYRISARKGASALQIFYRDKPIFKGAGLSVIRIEDLYGSWGGMLEESDSTHLSTVQERWKIQNVELLESGPERASVWVRFAGKQSRLDMTFSLARERPVVDVFARVFWNERSSRLQLVFPLNSSNAEFEVPGGRVQRGECGEVPGGRWVKVNDEKRSFGFASDALYSFNCRKGALYATVVRASRYANDVKTTAEEEPWRPAVDAGELTFRFLITAQTGSLAAFAQELEQPVVTQIVPPHPGALSKAGSLFSIKPSNLQVLALKPAENGDGWIVRVQELAGKAALLQGCWLNQEIDFGPIKPTSINSFRLTCSQGRWQARTTDSQERDV